MCPGSTRSACSPAASRSCWLRKRFTVGNIKRFGLFWFLTIALGVIFLIGTGREWYGLIYHDGLTIQHEPVWHYILFAGRAACVPRDRRRHRPEHHHAFHYIRSREAGTCGPGKRVCHVLAFCGRNLGGSAVGGLFHNAIIFMAEQTQAGNGSQRPGVVMPAPTAWPFAMALGTCVDLHRSAYRCLGQRFGWNTHDSAAPSAGFAKCFLTNTTKFYQ